MSILKNYYGSFLIILILIARILSDIRFSSIYLQTLFFTNFLRNEIGYITRIEIGYVSDSNIRYVLRTRWLFIKIVLILILIVLCRELCSGRVDTTIVLSLLWKIYLRWRSLPDLVLMGDIVFWCRRCPGVCIFCLRIYLLILLLFRSNINGYLNLRGKKDKK